ncbi:hypothetical protein B0H14DRAFT_2626375 [Mycena olivaceomarginata]|nr:hypothetical protein B0H14DRAFT_2626375 [Mycena olivaceomarginata]
MDKSCQSKFSGLKVFRAIQDIQGTSGFHWDNDTGASIDVASADAWKENSGWPHLSLMEQIMPAKAKGTHVFRASQAVVASQAVGDDEDVRSVDGNGATTAAAPAGLTVPAPAVPAFQTTPHRRRDAVKRAQRLEK